MEFVRLNTLRPRFPCWMRPSNLYATYTLRSVLDYGKLWEAEFYCTRSGGSVGCFTCLLSGSDICWGLGKTGSGTYDRESYCLYEALVDMGVTITAADQDAGFMPGVRVDTMLPVLKGALEGFFGVGLKLSITNKTLG